MFRDRKLYCHMKKKNHLAASAKLFREINPLSRCLLPVASGHGKLRPTGRKACRAGQIMTVPYLHWLHRVMFRPMAESTKEPLWVCLRFELYKNNAEGGSLRPFRQNSRTVSQRLGFHPEVDQGFRKGYFSYLNWTAFHTCIQRLLGCHLGILV